MRTRRILPYSLPVFLLLFTVLTTQTVAQEFSSHDEKIARIYTEEAIKCYLEDDISKAKIFVEKACAFSLFIPEAQIVRACILAKEKQPGYFERAKPLFREYLPEVPEQSPCKETGTLIYAELLFRSGEYIEATKLLSRQFEKSDSFQIGFLLGKSLYSQGKTNAAKQHLFRLLSRYPNHNDIEAYLISIDLDYAKNILTKYFHNKLEIANISLPALLELARQSKTETVKKELLRQYLAKGGDSPHVYIEGLNLLFSPLEAVDGFIENGGLERRRYITAFYRALPSPDIENMFQRKIETYSGVTMLDTNNDTFSEGKYSFSNGQLETAQWDKNQDGIYDFVVSFQNGYPVQVEVTKGTEVYTVVYDQYPEVKKVEHTNSKIRTIYHLVKSVFPFPVLKGTAPEKSAVLFPPGLIPNVHLPKHSSLERISLQIEIESRQRETITVFPGFGNSLREIRSANWKAFYRGDRIVRSAEDIDKDGKVEILRLYDGGTPIEILVDINNNGIWEYREQHLENRRVFWDFDEDGKPNCIETYTAEGMVVREYPPVRSGQSLLRITSQNGIIESIERIIPPERIDE
jgi:tetratricopeptide (TPR) repeat protein